jgi:hypothetical protein
VLLIEPPVPISSSWGYALGGSSFCTLPEAKSVCEGKQVMVAPTYA